MKQWMVVTVKDNRADILDIKIDSFLYRCNTKTVAWVAKMPS